jgi:hypothetical protein
LTQNELEQESQYPMNLSFYPDCYAVQIMDKINSDLISIKSYFYFASSIETLSNDFKEYAADVVGCSGRHIESIRNLYSIK